MNQKSTNPVPADKAGTDLSKRPASQVDGFLITHPLNKMHIRWGEFLIEKCIVGVSFLSIAFIVLIFLFVFREASPIFFKSPESLVVTVDNELEEMETYGEEQITNPIENEIEMFESKESKSRLSLIKKLFGNTWQPVSLNPAYGLLPLFFGSIKVAFIAIFISAPLAILAALYSAMFAPRWIKEIIKPIIEILAGFPSVVIGFFVLVILASVIQDLFGFQYRLNAFVGGVALSLAIIPVIFTLSEDALVAVPRSLVEASLALGAFKWETALFVVLPAAIPGIFAAVLLGTGRAIGETMIALMVTGNAALISLNIAEPVRTMSAAIGAEMAEVVFGDNHYSVLFLQGVLLFAFSFTLNVIVEVFIRQKLMKRFKGS